MSADNGIYVGMFNDGIRVIEAQAIENTKYEGVDSPIARAYQYLYYRKSIECKTLDEAYRIADKLAEDGYTEYGICKIQYNHDFPQMTSMEAHEILFDVNKK